MKNIYFYIIFFEKKINSIQFYKILKNLIFFIKSFIQKYSIKFNKYNHKFFIIQYTIHLLLSILLINHKVFQIYNLPVHYTNQFLIFNVLFHHNLSYILLISHSYICHDNKFYTKNDESYLIKLYQIYTRKMVLFFRQF